MTNTLLSRLAALVSCVSLLLLQACSSAASLTVDVATELVPGRELGSLEIALVARTAGTGTSPSREDVLRSVEADVRAGQDLSRSARVAHFAGLTPGVHLVRVRARRPDGTWLLTTRVLVQVDGARVVRVRLSRACVGVECPVEAGADLSACVDGRCVEPSCTVPGAPECLEPPDACTVDAECVRDGLPACAQMVCDEGECAAVPDDARCGAPERCDVVLGCVPTDLRDAGDGGIGEVGDAGAIDSGANDTGPLDVGTQDAGPPVLCAVPSEPCAIGVIRVVGAEPICVPTSSLADGTPCGAAGAICLAGRCTAPVAYADFPQRWAEASCAAIADCLGADHVWLGRPGDCVARMRAEIGSTDLGRKYLSGEGDAPYDPLGAARCVAAIASSCGAFVQMRQNTLPECDAILRCGRGETALCNATRDCEGGLRCVTDDSYTSRPTVCAATIGVNEACVTPGPLACEPGLSCRTIGTVGMRCTGSRTGCGRGRACATDLEVCVDPPGERDPSCVPWRAVAHASAGSACAETSDCSPGLVCLGMVCTTPLTAGAACVPGTSTEDPCADGACVAGACGSEAALGEPCRDNDQPLEGRTRSGCVLGLQCRGSVCVTPAYLGEVCDATRTCEASTTCMSGRCVANEPLVSGC